VSKSAKVVLGRVLIKGAQSCPLSGATQKTFALLRFSQLTHKRHSAATLVEHLVGAAEQRGRNFETERSCRN
jgi:hypothetical protein